MTETKNQKGRLLNVRFRKQEDPAILEWLDNQSNLAAAVRYFIVKDIANYGYRDLSKKAADRLSDDEMLNDFYNDILHVLPKLQQEQKMMLLFKLQAELSATLQTGVQMQPSVIPTQPAPVYAPISNTANESEVQTAVPAPIKIVQEKTDDLVEQKNDKVITSDSDKVQASEIDRFTNNEVTSESLQLNEVLPDETEVQLNQQEINEVPKAKPDETPSEIPNTNGQKAKKKRNPSKKLDPKGWMQ
ncbi:hypothetical protein [Niallia taxi]|uniref:hypothetical protein n=1 Tax=Niallia taxi TaxID=2499688 RepID=UPI0015F4F447|nr:hypothetical protein [Niallia taxi]